MVGDDAGPVPPHEVRLAHGTRRCVPGADGTEPDAECGDGSGRRAAYYAAMLLGVLAVAALWALIVAAVVWAT